jgi:hypothetical protein
VKELALKLPVCLNIDVDKLYLMNGGYINLKQFHKHLLPMMQVCKGDWIITGERYLV